MHFHSKIKRNFTVNIKNLKYQFKTIKHPRSNHKQYNYLCEFLFKLCKEFIEQIRVTSDANHKICGKKQN